MPVKKRKPAVNKRSASPRVLIPDDGKTITIVGRSETPAEEGDFLSDDIIKISDYLYERKVETSTVRANVNKFLKKVGDIVGDAPRAFGNYELHEIEISAELTLSGELKIWGIGAADVEGKAGIKFLIRHNAKAPIDKP
jgi:hypothetical protein